MGQYGVTPTLDDTFKEIKARLARLEKFVPLASVTAAKASVTIASPVTGAITQAPFAAVVYDNFGRFANSAGGLRYVVAIPGVYQVIVLVATTNLITDVVAFVYQNGSEAPNGGHDEQIVTNSVNDALVVWQGKCAAGDTLDARYFLANASTPGATSVHMSVVGVA